MKLKYERFEGLGCLYVRGSVDEKYGKLLQVGVETISKDLEETLVINLTQAQVTLLELPILAEFKKKMSNATAHKIYWIAKERGLADFTSIDVFISRMPGAKSRQIGERIKADDSYYSLSTQMQEIQNRILELGGNEDQVVNLIMDNASLKEQQRIFEETIKYQAGRLKVQFAEQSRDSDIKKKIEEQHEMLKQYYGKELDL